MTQQRRYERQPRFKGEKGIAIITTALVLIPLMMFAAYGVDLASWYSRVSYLQKSADAASLAGTVWMPNLTRSTTEACASLRQNGITGAPACGSGPFNVTIERGATSTSLRVIVTDPDARRYFSQVFRGTQVLTRSAEAEYNLPIPLGSPLNYFGGDADRTQLPDITSYSVDWPTPYNNTRPPAVAQNGETAQGFSCNVGTSSAQGFGRWTNATTYDAGGYSGSTRCLYTVTRTNNGTASSAVPPPDYSTRAPNTVACRVRTNGTGTVLGRWSGSPAVFSTSTSGSEAACQWRNSTSGPLPPGYNGSATPANRPCRVSYNPADGWWGPNNNSGFTTTSVPSGGAISTGNKLCRWPAQITTTVTSQPNPIDSSRSPGFWAAIEGPQTRTFQGDAYNTRCYTSTSCTSDQSASYLQPSNADRGFWYVIKIPAGLSGSVALNVFDASYVTGGGTSDGAGDRALDDGGNFTTTYRVYQQTNALDFSQRTPVTASAANTADGSCNWSLFTEVSFQKTWRNLCNLTVSPGQTYLLNVQTTGTTGAGVNGYALEAVAGGSHANVLQPALYAYSNMGMQNNNSCSGSGCTIPPATFYLAEVGPQYAGRTLVMELFDSGDVGSGVTATLSPMRPSPTAFRPVVNVPAADCTYTADTNPNAGISGTTGAPITSPQGSDNGTNCAIVTTNAGTQRFNGEWLRIRIDIPATYDCVLGVNPENTINSCWWGIRYSFTGGTGSSITANDVTTWQARIEGNPVHLTD